MLKYDRITPLDGEVADDLGKLLAIIAQVVEPFAVNYRDILGMKFCELKD